MITYIVKLGLIYLQNQVLLTPMILYFIIKQLIQRTKYFTCSGIAYRKIIRGIFHGRGDVSERIRVVILHVHSRFDMCGSCAYSLDWELKEGFCRDILDFCRILNGNSRLAVDISSFVWLLCKLSG